jgi:hypothetical protein
VVPPFPPGTPKDRVAILQRRRIRLELGISAQYKSTGDGVASPPEDREKAIEIPASLRLRLYKKIAGLGPCRGKKKGTQPWQ